MKNQFNLDKNFPFRNVSGSSLLRQPVSTNDNYEFYYEIEGVINDSFLGDKNLQEQIITNKLSELVYFSFEIQRQVLLLYKDNPKEILKPVLDKIIFSVLELKTIVKSRNDYEWYDHCVTNRTLFLRDLLLFLAKLNDFLNYKKIYKLYLKHLKFIKSNINYDFLTNHGIITDTFGLLALRGLENSNFKATAKFFYNRSLSRIDHYISDDGVPLESSTTYWFLIYKLYKKIIDVGNMFFGFTPSDYQKNKLKNTENFFDLLWLNGSYLRIGQSSGAHNYPVDVYKPKLHTYKNLLLVNKFDTGLILINGYDKKAKIFFQLLVNTQSIYPKVHGHEDNGVICLFYKGNIYFDTPGSYKFKDITNRINIDPKSFKNQSLCYKVEGNYLHKISKIKLITNQNKIIIEFDLLNQHISIKRTIIVDCNNSSIIVNDKTNNTDNKITSQLLLNSEGKMIRENLYKVKDIEISSENLIQEKKGYLSFERGTIRKVPLLSVESFKQNQIDIKLCLKEIFHIENNLTSVLYKKRKLYRLKMFLSKTKRRIIYFFVKLNSKLHKQ